VGYDTVVLNWLVALTGGRGFVRRDGIRSGVGSSSRNGNSGAGNLSDAVKDKGGAGGNNDNINKDEFDDSLAEAPLIQLRLAAEYVAASGGSMAKFLGFKLGVVLTSLFLFSATTTLVAFTLRETQERMIKFTFLLQHHVRHNLSYVSLIFSHLVDSLVYIPIMVGMLFFLFEFYGDQLLAFLVLAQVWLRLHLFFSFSIFRILKGRAFIP